MQHDECRFAIDMLRWIQRVMRHIMRTVWSRTKRQDNNIIFYIKTHMYEFMFRSLAFTYSTIPNIIKVHFYFKNIFQICFL